MHYKSRNKSRNGYRRTLAGIALAFVTASAASAQSTASAASVGSRVVLPAGSVIIVRTTAPLQSASVKQGQMFETNVEESVGVDEFTVIPAGSKVRGVVACQPSRYAIGCHRCVFDRPCSNGSTFPHGSAHHTDSGRETAIETIRMAGVCSDGVVSVRQSPAPARGKVRTTFSRRLEQCCRKVVT